MPDDASQFENLVSIYKKTSEQDKLGQLMNDIATEDSNRQTNILMSSRWWKKRFGIRPQTVTWPWRNASNLHIPLTDKTIRRAKPNFANLVGSNYPTIVLESDVLGDDQNLVRAVEREFQKVNFDEEKMNAFPKICWGIDMMLERGRFITKVVQEFSPQVQKVNLIVKNLTPEMLQFLFDPKTSDSMLAYEISLRYNMKLDDKNDIDQIKIAIKQLRAGKDTISFERKFNQTPFPTLVIRDPNTVLFPQDTTFLIGGARWIRDRVYLSDNDIISRIEGGQWDKENGNRLLDEGLKEAREFGSNRLPPDNIQQVYEQQREGISPQRSTGLHCFDEIYFFKRFPGEQLARRCVLTVQPDHEELPLRLIDFPYVQPDGTPEEWPFDQVQFEIVGDRAYSPRGYPQILDSLQTEITNNHNAKQNHMQIANNLNLKAKRNSGVSTQWVPGQPLWVNRMDDATEINIANKDQSYAAEETALMGMAEGYIGLLDQNLTNMTGTPERRTKAEVDAVSALQAQVASLDVRIFQSCMQRVYRKVWNRWIQYGPDSIPIMAPDGGVRQVSKEQIRGWKVRTVGDIFSTNRQLKSNRYWGIMEKTAGSPYIDGYKMLLNCMSLEDERLAMDVMRTPEEAQQVQVERFADDISRINDGYTVIPRPSDDNQIALQVIKNYLQDPKKRRNLYQDRMGSIVDFYKAHELAAEKKKQATTRGGRAEQEVAAVAQGASGREARA